MNIFEKFNYILLINIIKYINSNKKYNLIFNINVVNKDNLNNVINFFDMLFNNIDETNIYYNIIYNNLINVIKHGYKNNTINSYYKRKFFKIINFANTNNVNLNNIKIHKDSLYSVTNYYDANYISNLIYKHYNTKDIIITDGTANIGGNTLSFGLYKFKLINSIELNKNCYNYLINNIKCYNLKNIKAINENYLKLYKILNQDVVFLDPPWGGPNYKNKTKLNLYLDNINIIDIIFTIFEKTKTTSVLLKAPYNYNISDLKTKNNNVEYKTCYLKKFQIIFLYKKLEKELNN